MTLGELLMVFIIMGVVASMTLMSAKPLDKSIKYAYMQTYNVLGTAFFNAMQTVPSWIEPSHMDGSFPKYTREFCVLLIQYINTSDGSTNAKCSDPPINIYNKFYDTLDAKLDTTPPHFIASNGVKYWIATTKSEGRNVPYEEVQFHSSADTSIPESKFTTRFYMIIADLNGDMPPNTTAWAKNKLADRVAFAVTETADVLPMGPQEFDIRYMNAQVVYAQTGGVEVDAQNTSKPVSYYEAKRMAWGIPSSEATTTPGLVLSNGIYVSPDNPMSINPYSNLSNQSPFYVDYSVPRVYEQKPNTYNAVSYTSMANISYKDNTAGTCKSEFVNALGNLEERFDPDACYIKIADYN